MVGPPAVLRARRLASVREAEPSQVLPTFRPRGMRAARRRHGRAGRDVAFRRSYPAILVLRRHDGPGRPALDACVSTASPDRLRHDSLVRRCDTRQCRCSYACYSRVADDRLPRRGGSRSSLSASHSDSPRLPSLFVSLFSSIRELRFGLLVRAVHVDAGAHAADHDRDPDDRPVRQASSRPA